MGFFNKIKNNLTGGGVKVSIEAPDTINREDGQVSVSVVLQANSEQSIKGIKLELVEVSEEQSLGYSDDDSTERNEAILATATHGEQFVLTPEEQKKIDLVLNLPSRNKHEANNSLKNKAKSAFAKVSRALDTNEYSYYFKARADVEGVAIDPTSKKDVILTQVK